MPVSKCRIICLVCLFSAALSADSQAGRQVHDIEALERQSSICLKDRYDAKADDAAEKLKSAFQVYGAALAGKAALGPKQLKSAIRYQRIVVQFHQWMGDTEAKYDALGALIAMVAKPEGYGPEAAAGLAIKNADQAFEKKDFDDALRIYRIIVEAQWAADLDERNYCRLCLGRCQAKQGKDGAAFETYKALMRDAPKSDWAGEAMLYARPMYFRRRNYDEAIQSYQRLLEANPKCKRRPFLMEDMAFSHIKKKEYDKAEQILKQVIDEYAGVDATSQRPEGVHVSYARHYLHMIKEKKKAESSDE